MVVVRHSQASLSGRRSSTTERSIVAGPELQNVFLATVLLGVGASAAKASAPTAYSTIVDAQAAAGLSPDAVRGHREKTDHSWRHFVNRLILTIFVAVRHNEHMIM